MNYSDIWIHVLLRPPHDYSSITDIHEILLHCLIFQNSYKETFKRKLHYYIHANPLQPPYRLPHLHPNIRKSHSKNYILLIYLWRHPLHGDYDTDDVYHGQ